MRMADSSVLRNTGCPELAVKKILCNKTKMEGNSANRILQKTTPSTIKPSFPLFKTHFSGN